MSETAEGSTPEDHPDHHPGIVAGNARAGLGLFGVYLLLYVGFVGLSAFAPGVMARPSLGGLNLAIVYGLGLIAAAFVLALVYMILCRRIADRHVGGGAGR